MRNKRFLIVLAGALLFGLLAAVSVSRYLSSAQAFSKNLSPVAVAKVGIPLGTKIIAEQIMVVQFPKESTPDGAFDTAEKLVGRVAIVNIGAREPVTEARLAPEGTAGGLSAVIPEGYRAMTVKVDDVVGISGFIMPGTLVDVVVVIDPAEKTGMQDPISKIVLQNIKVLANGQNIDKPEGESQREANSVKAVTLQVTPEQAEKLALSASEGKLQLVMRNPTDQGNEQTIGINKRTLLHGDKAVPAPDPGSLKSERPSEPKPVRRVRVQAEAKPVAAQSPEKPRASVEMIEGAKKRSVDFP
ncbi:MAG: Flp pilus assembly protein CpaB [Pyrinomonadaceae bacterium]